MKMCHKIQPLSMPFDYQNTPTMGVFQETNIEEDR